MSINELQRLNRNCVYNLLGRGNLVTSKAKHLTKRNMNKESETLTITRRFNSLTSAIETFESEGKLDLSYNRPLAISDAKYTDNRSKPAVMEINSELHMIVRAPDGMDCMTKFTPFSSTMHDGNIAVLLPVNGSGVICSLSDAVAFNRLCELPNNKENRKLVAKVGSVAGY